MSINQDRFWIQGTSSLSQQNSMCCSVSHPSCHFFFFTCEALKFSPWCSGIQRTSQTLQGWLIIEENWRQSGRWDGRLVKAFFSRSRNRMLLNGIVVVPLSRILAYQRSPMDHLSLIDTIIPTHLHALSPSLALFHPLEISHQITIFLTILLPVNDHQNSSGFDCFEALFQFTTGLKILQAEYQDFS